MRTVINTHLWKTPMSRFGFYSNWFPGIKPPGSAGLISTFGWTMWPLRCAGLRRSAESTLKAPGSYPSGDAPYLEWAVMQDPFGNQFCFVKWPLTWPAAVERASDTAEQ